LAYLVEVGVWLTGTEDGGTSRIEGCCAWTSF